MKDGTFSFRDLLRSGPGRARLAVVLGAAAMLLILLSELWPRPAAESASVNTGFDAIAYQQQLEQRLEELIGEMEGAGQTKVMVTLETGEERIYALDTQRGRRRRAGGGTYHRAGRCAAGSAVQPYLR